MILLLLLALSQQVIPIDCDQVRAKVAEYGRVKAIYWARSQGYSWAQINEARRQCGV